MSTGKTDATMRVLMLIMGLLLIALGVQTYRQALSPHEYLAYSTCSPESFDDGSCDDDPNVDPDILILDDELGIAVSGEVFFSADRPVSYRLEVVWVATTGAAKFGLIDVDVTYEPLEDHRPYAVVWAAPNQLLADTAGLPACSDLGSWRVTGVATPLGETSVATARWDSVETFRLRTPGDCG